ncbi:hypothetical protein F5B19DRAFT_477006 [Rostrohypoxylon terebratum]|nr:hypothetical protein F5B19DRAFT_477006 [Rostrohypoxylon terebratum]
MSSQGPTQTSSTTASESSITLIEPSQRTDAEVVREILQVFDTIISHKVGEEPDLPLEQCEYHITKSIWKLFVRFLEPGPYYQKMPPLQHHPPELVAFKDKRRAICGIIQMRPCLEFDLDRNWLLIRIQPNSQFLIGLRNQTMHYVTDQVKRVFRTHFPNYVIEREQLKPALFSRAGSYYYCLDAYIFCYEKGYRFKQRDPAFIVDFGFAQSVKEDRFQAYIEKGNGALCIMSLDVDYDIHDQETYNPSSPPIVQLKAWAAAFDPRNHKWVPELIQEVPDLRAKVSDDWRASLELYPYDFNEDFNHSSGVADATRISISLRRLLDFVDDAWADECMANGHRNKASGASKRLVGQREQWLPTNRVNKA